MNKTGILSLAAIAMAAATGGCGYHVSGHGDLLPKDIKTIAVPAFSNATTRYKLTDHLAQAITREFISRTHYRVVSDPSQADAVLHGSVINYTVFPTVFDTTTGRSTGVQMNVTLRISLVNRATGAVIYDQPSFEVHQRYEISSQPQNYFDESGAALDRVSEEVAHSVVSAILEVF